MMIESPSPRSDLFGVTHARRCGGAPRVGSLDVDGVMVLVVACPVCGEANYERVDRAGWRRYAADTKLVVAALDFAEAVMRCPPTPETPQ